MPKNVKGEFIGNSNREGADKVLRLFGEKVMEGPPRATEGFTIDQQKADGLVGLYLRPEYRLSDVEGEVE